MPLPSRIRLSVPATTANLGPGFDALGAALSLRNTFEITRLDAPPTRGEATGPEAVGLAFGPGNLVSQGFAMAWRLAAAAADRAAAAFLPGDVPPHAIRADVHIPQTRGLGSSSSALAAGALAAWRMAGRDRVDAAFLEGLVALEGHADNLAPAVLGGLVAAAWDPDARALLWSRHEVAPELAAVLFIPDAHLPTEAARALIPDAIPRADAIHNLARTPLVVEALRRGDLELLARAAVDRLHEPYRKARVPLYEAVRDVADAFGPLPCMLSGAGPTMLVWTLAPDAPDVAAALEELAEREHVAARVEVLRPDPDGWLLLEEA